MREEALLETVQEPAAKCIKTHSIRLSPTNHWLSRTDLRDYHSSQHTHTLIKNSFNKSRFFMPVVFSVCMNDVTKLSRSHIRDIIYGAVIIILSITLAILSSPLPLLLVIGLILTYSLMGILTTYHNENSRIVLASIIIGGAILTILSLAINYLKYNPSGQLTL